MQYSSEIIGKNIRIERKKLCYSQEKLGQKIGITGKQISIYEKGKIIPPLDILLRLCEIFGCELGYLLGESSYAEGTKLLTAISNYTGLSSKALKQIVKITGQTRDCIHWGYHSDEYRAVLNKLLTSEYFIEFIETMKKLDDVYSKRKEEMQKIDQSFPEITDKIREYIGSHLDETCDLSPTELDDLQQNQSLIDQKYSIDTDFEYNMKVYRFDLQEKFILLLNDLYKTDE
ncbi:MAG: helix-turn-helix transcriptional regulator [Oscillospiraceae bacterium]